MTCVKSSGGTDDEELDRILKLAIPMSCEAVVPIAAKLVKKFEDVAEIDKEFKTRREEFDIRMKKLAQRKVNLEKKEKLLLETLKKFDDFIKDNEKKMHKADVKYSEEKEIVLEKDKEIEELKMARDVLAKEKEELEKYVTKYLPAKQFLDSVAEASIQYEDAADVISHYDTVVAVYQELVEQEQKLAEESEKENEKLNEFKSETADTLLDLSNQFYALQWESEKAHNKLLELEAQLEDAKASELKKLLNKKQILMGISSMYAAICDFEKTEPTEQDALKQMDKIYEFIQDWSEVVTEVKYIEEMEN